MNNMQQPNELEAMGQMKAAINNEHIAEDD